MAGANGHVLWDSMHQGSGETNLTHVSGHHGGEVEETPGKERKALSEGITILRIWIVAVVTQVYKFVDSSKYILEMSGSCM